MWRPQYGLAVHVVVVRVSNAVEAFRNSVDVGALPAKDGNGHRIPAYPRISNPAGADTGDRVHPRARVRAEF